MLSGQPARITFTHVFFSAERHGKHGAIERAAETLRQLRDEGVRYAQAGQYGERFLYGLNFADRSKLLIDSQFGTAMTETLFSGDVPIREWSGPYETEHGAHIVLLAHLEPGREPTLEQVLPQVTQQATRALAQRRAKKASQQIVERYAVELAYPQREAVN